MAVTRRQKEVLDFLTEFVEGNGYSPSFEEIAHGLGLKSLATVHKHVTNLQAKGLLQRAHNRSRSIDVLPQHARDRFDSRLTLVGVVGELPIGGMPLAGVAGTLPPGSIDYAGVVGASQPVESVESSGTISLGDIVGRHDAFALKVRGDSMRDDHILDGDYVLVERTKTARQGEIVVALVRGLETTLKRYYIEGSVARLQPSNSEMKPIFVPLADLAIQGKVLGLLRKY